MQSSAGATPNWRVAAPFFDATHSLWIDRFVPPEQHTFTHVDRLDTETSWHNKTSGKSGAADWLGYVRQSREAISQPSTGLIAVFPQLTLAMATLLRRPRETRPLVSWFFNTTLESSTRVAGSRAALSRVDRFIVHSTVEIDAYASTLKLPTDRFEFAARQFGGVVETEAPNRSEPYIFATGSGFRDYATFFKAVGKLGYPTLVLAGPRILKDLDVPSNVEIIDAMPRAEIRRHVRHARVNALPMTTSGLTAGLITIVECFRHGRAMVATDRSGVEDYLIDDDNALLAQPSDVAGLAERLEAVWEDKATSDRLDAGALRFAEAHCTDEAAGNRLVGVLDSVLASPRVAARQAKRAA